MNYGESNPLRVKIAAILAAVKFWMKYKNVTTPNLRISILNDIFYVKLTPKTSNKIEVQLDDEVFELKYENDSLSIQSLKKEKKEEFKVKFPRKDEIKLKKGEVLIRAQTAGKIMKILVKEGEVVKKDDVLIVMEAMKMEIELNSPFTGIIRRVFVKTGDVVRINDPLIIIEQKSR